MQAIKQIRQLRPSIGLSRIKKVLEMHGNSIDRSLQYLDRNAITYGKDLFGAKLHTRTVNYGTVNLAHNDDEFIVFSNWCETDFVAKTQGFKDMAKDIGNSLISKESYNDSLFKAMGEFKELIKVQNLIKRQIGPGEYLQSYQHSEQQLCVLLTNTKLDNILAKSVFAHGLDGNVLDTSDSISSFLTKNKCMLLFNQVFNLKGIRFQ